MTNITKKSLVAAGILTALVAGNVATAAVVPAGVQLGINLRQFTEQQIIVGHLTVGFNGVLSDVDQAIEYRPPLIADYRFMQLAAVAISFVMLKPGAGVADFIFHRHCQAVEPKRGVFAVKLGAGVMTQHRITE